MDLSDRAEELARPARADIDALAERLGTDRRVVQDEFMGCGTDGEGYLLAYVVRVAVEPGAEAAAAPVVAEMESDGWVVEQQRTRPDELEIQLTRGDHVMTAFVREAAGEATVAGSAGCVM